MSVDEELAIAEANELHEVRLLHFAWNDPIEIGSIFRLEKTTGRVTKAS